MLRARRWLGRRSVNRKLYDATVRRGLAARSRLADLDGERVTLGRQHLEQNAQPLMRQALEELVLSVGRQWLVQ